MLRNVLFAFLLVFALGACAEDRGMEMDVPEEAAPLTDVDAVEINVTEEGQIDVDAVTREGEEEVTEEVVPSTE